MFFKQCVYYVQAEDELLPHALGLWRPHYDCNDTEESQQLYHKFQGILNKLTLKSFDALAMQACQLNINTVDELMKIVDMLLGLVSFLIVSIS